MSTKTQKSPARTDGQTVDFFSYLQKEARNVNLELRLNNKSKKFEVYDLDSSDTKPVFEHPSLTPVKFYVMGFSACFNACTDEMEAGT